MHKRFLTLLKVRKRRLTELGYATYEEYLASLHWQARRAAYAAVHPPRCAHCSGDADALHHVSYERLGAEGDEDLLWLCDDHHREVHKWGEIKPATQRQRERLRLHGFGDEVVNGLTRGVAFELIDDIYNGRKLAPAMIASRTVDGPAAA